MRRVTVDPDRKILHVQGGALWKHVDEAAAEHGLATVGGTVNHTGVGGLTLGGGYGWLTGSYGLVVDNLLEVEMVLADGSIVVASKDENQELFWAVRGAGHSFGVVVRFTLAAYEMKHTVWAGVMVFGTDQLERVVEFANHLVTISKGEAGMLVGVTCPPPAFAPAVVTLAFYNGTKAKGEEFFAPLIQIGPLVNQVTDIPYQQVNALLNEVGGAGGRKAMKGPSFITPLDPAFARAVLNELTLLNERIPDAKATLILFEFHNQSKVSEAADTAMAFAGRYGYQNGLIGAKWTDPAHDADCRAWVRSMAQKFHRERERVMNEQGMHPESGGFGEYGNYDGKSSTAELFFVCFGFGSLGLGTGKGLANVDLNTGLGGDLRSVYGVNVDRLRKLKARFDPDNVFNRSQGLLPVAAS